MLGNIIIMAFYIRLDDSIMTSYVACITVVVRDASFASQTPSLLPGQSRR